jgi:hypothetical protein
MKWQPAVPNTEITSCEDLPSSDAELTALGAKSTSGGKRVGIPKSKK